jgi:hypothetical protein
MITIPGNHDLPEHNLGEYHRSALRTLEVAGTGWIVGIDKAIWIGSKDGWFVDLLPWGSKEIVASSPLFTLKILLAHIMILDGPAQFEGEQAESFLNRHYLDYKLIVTGHNHKPIWIIDSVAGGGRRIRRILVNVGSFTRQTASETHQPRVYLWYADTSHIEERIVPHDPDAITREHIEHKQEHDEKIAAFIDKVKTSADGDVVEVSFKVNVEMALGNIEISESVKSKLRRMLYGDSK